MIFFHKKITWFQIEWFEYRNAFRNITRQYRRSLFGISAVSFGVVALILAAGFIEWIFMAAREGAIHTGLGHVQVIRAGYLNGGQADSLNYLLSQQFSQMKAIANFPAVRTLAPRLSFNGLISHGDETVSFIGEGVSPEAELKVSRTLFIPSGQNLSSDDPKGIILGQGLAKSLNVGIGDTVVLLVNTSTGNINAVECTVRGIFNTVSKAYDDLAVRISLSVAQELLRVSGEHRWVLLLDDTALTAKTVLALREAFRSSNLEFIPWYDLADFYNKMVILLSTQIGVVKSIIAFIIILSISNTMMINVLERTTEIGTSLAIGRTRRQIQIQFIYEGLTIGFIGGSLGLFLGWLLAILISLIGIPMPAPPGMSQGYNGEILITGQLAFSALLLAVGSALLASFYPAWKASHMEIIDALRHKY